MYHVGMPRCGSTGRRRIRQHPKIMHGTKLERAPMANTTAFSVKECTSCWGGQGNRPTGHTAQLAARRSIAAGASDVGMYRRRFLRAPHGLFRPASANPRGCLCKAHHSRAARIVCRFVTRHAVHFIEFPRLICPTDRSTGM